jgi:hypothetical protein
MRYENSICRYDEDRVIERVLVIMGLPTPPAGKGRACVEEILRSPMLTMLADSKVLCDRLTLLLEILGTPVIEPTLKQVQDPTQAGRSLCVLGVQSRIGVDLHAGIGAVFYRASSDTLFSEAAPITGTGLAMRHDYLCSVIEAARDVLERSFS